MSQEQLHYALQRVRDRFFPESQPERDRDELWQLVNDALATQPEQAKGSEVDELVSLLAACRDIAARLAPGVADDLLMQAVGGPSEVPAYIEGVISELTNPAPAAQNEREANATARAFSLATMAAEEFVRFNGLSTGEADEFLMTGADLTDEYATACIEHLKHVGECVAFDCDDGVIVRLGDFTIGSLS